MIGVSEFFSFVLLSFLPCFLCIIQIYILPTLKGHANAKNYDSMRINRMKAA